jgi:hypothetical protein
VLNKQSADLPLGRPIHNPQQRLPNLLKLQILKIRRDDLLLEQWRCIHNELFLPAPPLSTGILRSLKHPIDDLSPVGRGPSPKEKQLADDREAEVELVGDGGELVLGLFDFVALVDEGAV